MAKYRVFPDYNAEGAYAGVLAYAAACKLANSTNKDAVARALEGLTVDIPAGRAIIRAQDHQAIFDGVWGQTGDFDGKLRIRTLRPLKIFPGPTITRPVEETDCKMAK